MPRPGTPEWFAQISEPLIQPDLPIVDPHHHLWPSGAFFDYDIDGLVADTSSGHNIVKTMFVECHAVYREDGPAHLRPVGETEFVVSAAAELARSHPEAAPIVGIVGHADLAHPKLPDVLDAHELAGAGLFRGIRDALASCDDPALMLPAASTPDRFADEAFRDGVRLLGARNLTYDSWHFHFQNGEFAELARACPETTMVLDHFGTPLGVGAYAGRADEIFDVWKIGIADASTCENAVLKLGGMAMPDNGFGWHAADRPATSDEFVAAQERYYHYAIECFGPSRCMFESNFPVDKLSLGYDILWNGLKKIAARYSDDEQAAMFSGTATSTYSLH